LPNEGGIDVFPILNIRSGDIRDSEVIRNSAEFCTFLAPKLFWGKAPIFWDLNYKIEHTSNHVAKFHSDQRRELRERGKTKKKRKQNISSKTTDRCPPGTTIPGGLNITTTHSTVVCSKQEANNKQFSLIRFSLTIPRYFQIFCTELQKCYHIHNMTLGT